jgi:tRNA pseudouridine38-40 synthase
VHVVVRGDGFLWNTVRIIAGTLVDVGLGRLEPGVVDEVLATGDRRRAGPTLPPQGLWLERIAYAGGEPS